MQTHCCGIEIGGTKLQIVAGDGSGTIFERQRFTVERAGGAKRIRRQIEMALPPLLARWAPAAVGVGFGGPVNRKTGCIARSHQIKGWSGFPLGEWLHRLAGAPVWVENDANTAALGEALRGAGAGCNPVFYLTLGSGVGGGCVVDGRIYHGATPGESEIGHVRLDKSGTIVEERCSGWAVDAKIRRLKTGGVKSVLRDWLPATPGAEAKLLPRALAAKDPAARQILEETAEDLALALSHITHLFHPEVIVLGGGLSLVGQPLRAAVAKALPRFVMNAFRAGPRVRLAALGEDAVPVGCLLGARLQFNL
ncbi:MAG: sugar kinase [Verrucomicrobia bacterium]|nr:MAG: sugar kinase [Verrucomicrobiota bacterium]